MGLEIRREILESVGESKGTVKRKGSNTATSRAGSQLAH